MDNAARAAAFAALHRPGEPVELFNIWDPGSAAAVAAGGAPALATGSWSVAAAFGHGDGHDLPLDLALENARRIVAAVDLPVTLDFEGAYAEAPEEAAANVARAAETGVIGCNIEDQVVGGQGLHAIDAQAARIAAIRGAVDPVCAGFFVNARTDIFLKAAPDTHDAAMVDAALERAQAYAGAGASGFFAPGLADPGLIERLCAAAPLPVNIMAMKTTPDSAAMAGLGVARISHGPGPFRAFTRWLRGEAQAVYGA
ncbi:MAG: isocitrate lyase/phosphoenolpyruvate mutase family protein [Pseudomonadota bacterium]